MLLAADMGKALVSLEELNELRQEVKKLNDQRISFKEDKEGNITEQVEEQIKHRLQIKKLEHDCEKANMVASVETLTKQVETLNLTINRMSAELDSQKKLTADVAGANRSVTGGTNSKSD